LPPGLTPKGVTAGWGHSSVLTEEGIVLMCGRNVHGQLGLGAPDSFPKNERGDAHQCTFVPVNPQTHGLETVQQVSCGAWHTLVWTEAGELYTSGGGNEGGYGQVNSWQLGHSDGNNSHYFQKVELPGDMVPVQVWCVSCSLWDLNNVNSSHVFGFIFA